MLRKILRVHGFIFQVCTFVSTAMRMNGCSRQYAILGSMNSVMNLNIYNSNFDG